MKSLTSLWANAFRRLRPVLLCVVGLGLIGSARAQLIHADAFNYPDGLLVGAAGSPWTNNYPPTNQTYVVSGQLLLSQTNQESVRIDFPSVNSGALYARMTVRFSALPTGDGNFFAFFRVGGTDNLRARIWATTNGAAPGRFRLGATTIFFPPAVIPTDLYLGTNYTLVTRYFVTNCHTTFWLNPTDESDTTDRVDDFTDAGRSSMGHFGFAQTAFFQAGSGNYIGTLLVDDLRLGRTFEEVLPSVKLTALTNAPNGVVGLVGRGQATTNYGLLASTNLLAGSWVNLGTATATTNGLIQFADPQATNFARRFYRLQRH